MKAAHNNLRIQGLSCFYAMIAMMLNSISICSAQDNAQVKVARPYVTYYADKDMDGFGDPFSAIITNSGNPEGYVTNDADADDSTATLPLFETTTDTMGVFYADQDGDGFGNPLVAMIAIGKAPMGYVSNATDADDRIADNEQYITENNNEIMPDTQARIK